MKNFSTLIKRVTAKPLNTGMFIIMLMLSLGLSTAQAKDRINYFHSDISGSPIAATNDSGEVLWEETYKPYGERLDNTPSANKDQNNQWFTGKQEEADLGLQYFGARWYHQASGRFISRDPAAVMDHVESNPMMFNRYAYANNNPYRYVDPDGKSPIAVALVLSFMAYDLFSSVGHKNAPGDDSIRPLFEGAELGLLGKFAKRADTASDVASGVGKEIGVLRDAAKGKGNFGLGSGTRAEADKLGKAWVGDSAKLASDGKTLVAKDGMRQYRPPSYKGRLDKTQANFEQKIPGQTTKKWQYNGHLDITD